MNTFAKQPDTQRKALQKALKSPLIGKHGKRRATLLKEEIMAKMQEMILGKVEALIDTQIRLALGDKKTPPNQKAIDSLLNRVFGKPAQVVAIKSHNFTESDEETTQMAEAAISDFLGKKN